MCQAFYPYNLFLSYVVDNLTLLFMAKKDGTEEGDKLIHSFRIVRGRARTDDVRLEQARDLSF